MSYSHVARPLRVLGIDPGLRITGFGVIDVAPQTLTYVSSRCVQTVRERLPDRLKEILTGVI
ncbi:MAG: crossover junction endodeoxyribonuclease RuvC, partial [Burkholderiales bacterium]|nr:crossover junction endodeoxyribonuclease RuvC [Burkholderiales bacterium]